MRLKKEEDGFRIISKYLKDDLKDNLIISMNYKLQNLDIIDTFSDYFENNKKCLIEHCEMLYEVLEEDIQENLHKLLTRCFEEHLEASYPEIFL